MNRMNIVRSDAFCRSKLKLAHDVTGVILNVDLKVYVMVYYKYFTEIGESIAVHMKEYLLLTI